MQAIAQPLLIRLEAALGGADGSAVSAGEVANALEQLYAEICAEMYAAGTWSRLLMERRARPVTRGPLALYGRYARTGRARAMTYTEYRGISRDDLHSVISRFPSTHTLLRRRAVWIALGREVVQRARATGRPVTATRRLLRSGWPLTALF